VAFSLTLLLLLPACSVKQPSEADDQLKAAISDGKWPDRSERGAKTEDPLLVDPDVLTDALGSYKYTAEQTFRYVGDDGVEESWVRERVAISVLADGRYRLKVDRDFRRVDDPPLQSGREAIFDGQRFYTRLRFGQWTVRDLLRKDHVAWLRGSSRHLNVMTRLLGDAMTRDRDGRNIKLGVGKWRPPSLPKNVPLAQAAQSEGPAWYAWWGRTHTPTKVVGRVTMDDTHNVVRACDLTVQAKTSGMRTPREVTSGPELAAATPELFGPGSRKDEPPEPEKVAKAPVPARGKATFTAELRLRIEPLMKEIALKIPPEGEVHDLKRPRPLHMIETILRQESGP